MAGQTKKKVSWKRPNYKGTMYQNLFRRIASLITRCIVNTSITPNQVTFFATLLCIFPLFLLFSMDLYLNIIAVAFVYLINILDKVDGQLARAKGEISKTGAFLDGILHNAVDVSILVPLGLRYYYTGGDIVPFLASVIALVFILMSRFNYLNRMFILGVNPETSAERLKVSKKVSRFSWLFKIYSIPGQHMPEMLFICMLFGFVEYLLAFYAAYNAFSFLIYSYFLSRF